jgi:D-glycero-alpha-D-manno-heptose-7-phosphate kinase
MPEFYLENDFGAVVSFAIDKYVYVTVNEKFDGRTRVSYSETENVDHPHLLKHGLVRNALSYFELRGLEITSVADIPGEGSGLGSSSAFTVGLARALDRYIDRDNNSHPSVYARIAYHIERDMNGGTVGKQDHYAAAYGGLHLYKFNHDETVTAQLLPLDQNLKFFLEENLMLFWTGRTRKAEAILQTQAERLTSGASKRTAMALRDMAMVAKDMIGKGDYALLGEMLDEAWKLKKKLSHVSDEFLDDIYAKAKKAGARGGKVLGAGGGGFMLFESEGEHRSAVEDAIGLRRVRFEVEERGSVVLIK